MAKISSKTNTSKAYYNALELELNIFLNIRRLEANALLAQAVVHLLLLQLMLQYKHSVKLIKIALCVVLIIKKIRNESIKETCQIKHIPIRYGSSKDRNDMFNKSI